MHTIKITFFILNSSALFTLKNCRYIVYVFYSALNNFVGVNYVFKSNIQQIFRGIFRNPKRFC